MKHRPYHSTIKKLNYNLINFLILRDNCTDKYLLIAEQPNTLKETLLTESESLTQIHLDLECYTEPLHLNELYKQLV